MARLPGTTSPPRVHLPYLTGIDGLRAIAVLAVILFHADVAIPGGFLGVEAFFVISGFLITGLLLTEWRSTGRISLRDFWVRRARRLLPALFFLLIGVGTFTAIVLPDEAAQLGKDIVAALAYVMNWYLISIGNSYFDPSLRPPLLQHLWSLAVEEQFYIVWPILMILGLRFFRLRTVLAVTLGLAAASFGLLLYLYAPDADPTRLYYGTDTRASALLIGAALAMVWLPNAPNGETPRPNRWLDGVGLLALVGLGASFFVLDNQHSQLYQGGLLAVSVLTAVVIRAVGAPNGLLPRLLAWAPLRWIGERSYSLYLWHWPVFMVTRPYADVELDGASLLVLRLLIVFSIAAFSYRFIEQPIRTGALGRTWRRVWATTPKSPASNRPTAQARRRQLNRLQPRRSRIRPRLRAVYQRLARRHGALQGV